MPVRREELRDEALRIEGAGIRVRVRPPGDHRAVAAGGPREVSQRNPVALANHLGDGGPQDVRPGAGGDEPRPVGGVLHVVGERDDLAVVVVPGREQLPHHDAQQAGRARPENDERLPRPAERAAAAQAEPGLPLSGPESLGGLGQEHLRQPVRRPAVGAALDAVSRAETPARIAERRRRAARPGRRFVGEEIDDVHVPREEAVVEDVQVRIKLPVRGALHGPPPGPVAFAALDEGQVERPVFGGEVVGMPQRVPGTAGLLRGTDAADHPPQFPHPQMKPDAEERPEPRSLPVPLPAARDRDQRAQSVQHQQGLAVVRDRQARPELVHHLSERSRASVQHPQQVHKGAVPAEPVGESDPPALGAGVWRRNRLEEQLVHRPNVVLAAPEPGGVRRTGEIRMRRQDVRDQGFAEELVNALPRLAHDGVRIEVRLEDRRTRSRAACPPAPPPRALPRSPRRSGRPSRQAVRGAAG